MLLEKKSRRKRIFRKCMVIFFTVVVMVSMCSITAFAEDSVLELGEVTDGETPWGWPLDGIYEAIRTMLFSMVQMFMSCAFGLLDGGMTYATTELAYTPVNYGGDGGIGSRLWRLVDGVADTVILPIGTIIFTYIVIYEFITMVIDKNNFHDFDTSIFIRWLFKTAVGVYFLSNSSTIVNAFFDMGTTLTTNLNYKVASTLVSTGSGTWADTVSNFYEGIKGFGIANLLGMLIPSFLIMIICLVVYVCIYIIVISRMCEIYLHLAVAPIPMATITNREFGESGKNYLKIIFSFILQAFFILLCIGLFKALVVSLAGNIGEDPKFAVIVPQMFQIVAFGVCMLLLMFKSQSLAKSLVGAH
ncbi:MAG: type IV secretion system protein [Oscillospiraceae bacterium]|nr:type IV secretion system protein [Oscillospiraceae bacterium]